MLKLILSYLPVHLISPTLIYPETLKTFFPLSQCDTMLPVMYAWQQLPGSSGSTHPCSPIHESSATSGEQGEDGQEYIRCTGKYDNISFTIKLHIGIHNLYI